MSHVLLGLEVIALDPDTHRMTVDLYEPGDTPGGGTVWRYQIIGAYPGHPVQREIGEIASALPYPDEEATAKATELDRLDRLYGGQMAPIVAQLQQAQHEALSEET